MTQAKSNTFLKECPKGINNFQYFPEIAQIELLDIEDAKRKILKDQGDFLSKLEEHLEEKSDEN